VAALAVGEPARKIAQSLASGEKRAVFLGNLAQHHPGFAQLHRLAQELAKASGAVFGFLGEAANSVGGYLAGAVPMGAGISGMDASRMVAQPRKAYLLLHAEMDLDGFDPLAARAALQGAELVVAMSPFKHRALEYAQVLLPVSPFTETAGTFVSTEGRVQSFQAVVRPLGETRPAWKVLRVLGTLMNLPGFGYESIEPVRSECLGSIGDVTTRLNNEISGAPKAVVPASPGMLERIGEVPIYHADAIVRQAAALHMTRDAQVGVAGLPGSLVEKLGLREGDQVRISQQGNELVLPFKRDDGLPSNCVRLPAACRETAALGPMFGVLTLERVAIQERATA
jgi:NADH-quinone oxidoreductase subunit G